jgi:hypothetical protein
MITVAILEDDRDLLLDYVNSVNAIDGFTVSFSATDPLVFKTKLKENPPDIVILDIDLGAGNQTGLDVAAIITESAILFLSGTISENIPGIESLMLDLNQPVMHITKPATESRIRSWLKKISDRLNKKESRPAVGFVRIFRTDSGECPIDYRDIAWITTHPSGESRDKLLVKQNGDALRLKTIKFEEVLERYSFPKELFKPNKSCIFNVRSVKVLNGSDTVIVQPNDREVTVPKEKMSKLKELMEEIG